jgi:hypothetical protein
MNTTGSMLFKAVTHNLPPCRLKYVNLADHSKNEVLLTSMSLMDYEGRLSEDGYLTSTAA